MTRFASIQTASIFAVILLLTACNSSFGRLIDGAVIDENTEDTNAPQVGSKYISISVTDPTSLLITWESAVDDSTPRENLEYMLLVSTSSEILQIDDPQHLPDRVQAVSPWQKNTTVATQKSLSTDTRYYYNVMVRDARGNFTIYNCSSATPRDNFSPDAGSGLITVGATTSSTIQISWPQASDNVSPQNSLKYKIVFTDFGPIDQIQYAQSLPEQNIASSWSAYSSPFTITKLNLNTKYYFNILVKDEKDNIAKYECASQTTSKSDTDTQSPAISDAAITITKNSDYTVSLSWTKATDPLKEGESTHSEDANLSYRVVSALNPITEANFTQANILTAAAGSGWEKDISSIAAAPSADGAFTYFCAAVKDEAGNTSYYTTSSADYSSSYRSSLAAYFKLDGSTAEATGKTSASLNGSPAYVDDAAFGSALCFAGNDNESMYMNINSSAFTAASNALTMSIWIKINSFSNAWEQIISKGGHGFRLQRYSTTNRLFFIISHNMENTKQSRIISKDEVADGKWHHVCAVFDTGGTSGSEHLYMYIDGVLQSGIFGAGNEDNWYDTRPVFYGSDAIRIGNNSDSKNFAGQEFTGKIDEVRIYSEALQANQIRNLSK